MTTYYNEIEPYAAAWLRNLIEAGHIAPGIVDERSIEDVYPSDLCRFTQCHFFAGIGVWSYALRQAGWSDDRPVWTGSCPCQPFSAAGKGAGFDDERHLWPAWHHLIKECKPAIVFGEQVASKDAEPWLELVQTDLEAMDYSFGAIPFPAASVGAPHIRDRLYWLANTESNGHQWAGKLCKSAGRNGTAHGIAISRLADTDSHGCQPGGEGFQAVGHRPAAEPNCSAHRLGDTLGKGLAQRQRIAGISGRTTGADQGKTVERTGICDAERQPSPGPVNGYWRDADRLFCRDGKWRPVEPGTFPLAHGAPARVGRLRAYGNAINAEAAKTFIGAAMECLQ